MNEEQAKQIQEGIDNLLRVQEDLELASNTAKSLGNETSANIFDNINIRAKQASSLLMAAGITVEAQKTLNTPQEPPAGQEHFKDTPKTMKLFPNLHKGTVYSDIREGTLTRTERLFDNQPEKKLKDVTVKVYEGSKGFGAHFFGGHFFDPEYTNCPFRFVLYPYTRTGSFEKLSDDLIIEITDVTTKQNSNGDFVWVTYFIVVKED